MQFVLSKLDIAIGRKTTGKIVFLAQNEFEQLEIME